MTIIRRLKSLEIRVLIWYYKIVNNYKRDINNLLKEQVNIINVSIAEVKAKKPAKTSSAKELFRKRAAIEEKLARPKSKRLSAYIPYNIKDLERNIDIDYIDIN